MEETLTTLALQRPHPYTHPEFALIIESVQQFDDVLVVAGGQDVDLHHVVLQFLLGLCVNNFGCS